MDIKVANFKSSSIDGMQVFDICVDRSRNVMTVGEFREVADFDPGPKNFDIFTGEDPVDLSDPNDDFYVWGFYLSKLNAQLEHRAFAPQFNFWTDYPHPRTDILFQSVLNGANKIWYMNGVNNIANSSVLINGLPPSSNWQIAAVGDFFPNGHSDIVVQNLMSGEKQIWEMKNNEVIASHPIMSLPVATDYQVVGASDFNRDGYDDLILQNPSQDGGELWVYYLYKNEVIDSRHLGDMNNYRCVGTGNINADLYPDLLFYDTATGKNIVVLMFDDVFGGAYFFGAQANWQFSGSGTFGPIGDSVSDILLENKGTNQRGIWQMQNQLMPGVSSVNWLPNLGSEWEIKN